MTDEERLERRRTRDREYQRKRRAENPERVKLLNADWTERNREKTREYMRKRRAADPEGDRAKQKAWREKNADWIKEYERRRRAKAKPPPAPPKPKFKPPETPPRLCIICTKEIPANRHSQAVTCSAPCVEEKKRRYNAEVSQKRTAAKARLIGPVILDPWKI